MIGWRSHVSAVLVTLVQGCADTGSPPDDAGLVDAGSRADARTDGADVVDVTEPADAPFVGCGTRKSIVNLSKCCGPPAEDVDVGCDTIGDGLTYCECSSNADCTDSGRLRCGFISYCFDFSDSESRVRVCVR